MENENEIKNVTVLGQQMSLLGVLEFTDNLVITGQFSGTIKSTGNLEIAEGAVVSCDTITCDTLIVSGNVAATITANTKIEMTKGAVVKGDITTRALRIEDSVDFEGQVAMLEEKPDIDLFSISCAEFKDCLSIKAKEAH